MMLPNISSAYKIASNRTAHTRVIVASRYLCVQSNHTRYKQPWRSIVGIRQNLGIPTPRSVIVARLQQRERPFFRRWRVQVASVYLLLGLIAFLFLFPFSSSVKYLLR